MRSICLGMTGSLGWVLSIKYLSRGNAGAIWSMYALSANLLLSHELLRNDLYTPRAVYMATRWVLHFQVCDLQDYFLITSLQSSFSFSPPFCDFKQTFTAYSSCFKSATCILLAAASRVCRYTTQGSTLLF